MSHSANSTESPVAVRATFARADQMQDAVARLSVSGFDRADLGLPSPASVEGLEPPEFGSKPASTPADARQARTLGVSTAAAAAAIAAVGVTVATGGAALPAIAAAGVAGSAAGGAVFAVTDAAASAEQSDRDGRAEDGELVLAVRTPTEAKRTRADAILRAAGATRIELVV
jgi:hypothetical protein